MASSAAALSGPPSLERWSGRPAAGSRSAPYAPAAAARAAIGEQASYAALVLGPESPQLLISSASGASAARALDQAAEVSQEAGQPVRVVDLHPLPPGDPHGLVSFM